MEISIIATNTYDDVIFDKDGRVDIVLQEFHVFMNAAEIGRQNGGPISVEIRQLIPA